MKTIPYKIDLYFEENNSQLRTDIKYKLKLNGYTTYFTKDKLIVNLSNNIKNTRNTFYIKVENINTNVKIQGEDKQIGTINYFEGKDESKWITNIPTYAKIKYEEVYKDIDLYYYINDQNLEYDFVLDKGANPNDISISFEGIDSIEINKDKDIIISIEDTTVTLLKPQVYQVIDNEKIFIDCNYILGKNNNISFKINEYNKELELVLDPILKLDYSTYIGGSSDDYATGIAVDYEGYVYITGYTEGKYPATTNQTIYGGGSKDMFITKLNSDGRTLIYSTYIGGTKNDYGTSIAIDNIGCAYITGITNSTDYPTTTGSYQENYLGKNQAVATKLSQTGNLLMYSTYLCANAYSCGNGIAVDKDGYAYITGTTQGIYPTNGAYQTVFGGNYDAFVIKLSVDGRYPIYSTYIGGTGNDGANAIVVDSEGCVYITGYTDGSYPTTKGSYQTIYAGGTFDGFVSKLSSDGKTLIYSTYIGGSDEDCPNAIGIDSEGCVYIAGYTISTDYPTISAYKTIYNGFTDGFISKLNKDGSALIYSTYIGESENEGIYSVAVDSKGSAYIGGYIGGNVVAGKLSVDGKRLINYNRLPSDGYASYARGIIIDRLGYVYISGYAQSNYQTTPNAYQSKCGGNYDAFVSKIFSIEYDLLCNFNIDKVKLLDTINTKIILKNLSHINIDINIQFQALDTSLKFIPNSLVIQNISQISNTIPTEIYISNISPEKTLEIELNLKYINEKFSQAMPITVRVEIYDNRTGTAIYLGSNIKTFYLNTIIGPNYIPGCNQDLYNLAIEGKLQTTDSGAPIIYYKSGSSYIYIEPNEQKYEYKVLLTSGNIKEYHIST